MDELNGAVARLGDDGNGLECILPAKHGSQIGSGFAFESKCIPVTNSSLCILSDASPCQGEHNDDARAKYRVER